MGTHGTGRRRWVAVGTALTLALTACTPGGGERADGDDRADDGAGRCAAYGAYGDLSGTTVSVLSAIVGPEQRSQEDSYAAFEACTGATIDHRGTRELEAELSGRLDAGDPPDLAYVPQPGLLRTLVEETGSPVPAPPAVEANVDDHWTAPWKRYGTVDGTFYAAPLGASLKSFVWYSPSMFRAADLEVPETWDEMMALTRRIAATGATPWCAGIASGQSTGWPATDWLEDVVLRSAGTAVYDQWYRHEIPFDDPRIVEALGILATVLKDPAHVNGGHGDVRSIATTDWSEAGLPILDGECWLHRGANFYGASWPTGTTVAEDGDVFAFYLPAMAQDERPVLGGGDFVTAFTERPEVQAFQTYLSSPEWANAKAVATPDGGWVSANAGLDPENLATDFDKLSAEILADPRSVIRFDASDLMPAAVGAGSFWTGMTSWFADDVDDRAVLAAIEASWPPAP